MFAAILLPIIAIVAWFSKTKKNDFELLDAVPMPNEGLVLPVETFCDKLKTR